MHPALSLGRRRWSPDLKEVHEPILPGMRVFDHGGRPVGYVQEVVGDELRLAALFGGRRFWINKTLVDCVRDGNVRLGPDRTGPIGPLVCDGVQPSDPPTTARLDCESRLGDGGMGARTELYASRMASEFGSSGPTSQRRLARHARSGGFTLAKAGSQIQPSRF